MLVLLKKLKQRRERGWKSKEAKTTQVGQSTTKDSQVKESQKGRGGQTKGKNAGSAFKTILTRNEILLTITGCCPAFVL